MLQLSPGLRIGLLLLIVMGWLAVSCTAQGPTMSREALPTPTILTASFTAVAGDLNQESIKEAQSTPETAAVEDEVDLELGQRIYGNLCAQCHGQDLQGTDQGGALTALEMTPEDFTVLLRTGGGIGNQHLFGTTRVSQTGIKALLGYLESLSDS